MAFLDSFRHLLNKTGDFTIYTSVKDPVTGTTTKTWVTSQAGVLFGFWTDKSIQTNVNEKFIDQKVGTIITDPALLTFTPTTKHKLTSSGIDYYIIGVDDIGEQGEVYKLTYRKEYV